MLPARPARRSRLAAMITVSAALGVLGLPAAASAAVTSDFTAGVLTVDEQRRRRDHDHVRRR